MKKRFFQLFVLSIALNAHAADEKIGDQTRFISGQDQSMNAAIAHARETLDSFLAISRNPPQGATDFKLKVMVTEGNDVEHLWFLPFKEIKGGFAGVLSNDPEVIKSMQFGKVYAFRRDQITDWGYTKDGKQKGSFTICVLFKSMDKQTVERYKRDHGFECN